jgi:DNA-binding beta-propeller fold protein YncE
LKGIAQVSFMVLIAALPCTAAALDRNPLLGTWSLDFAESTLVSGPPQYVRLTCKIEAWEDDGLKVIYDVVGTRGGVTHWEWTGKLDGQDYPLEGVEEVVTNAYSQIGDRTYNLVLKVDGRVTTSSKIAVSPDGKTMVVTTAGNTTVYRKR